MNSDMTSTDDSPLHGVSLSRYAAVQAAIGEGFDRDAALAVEGFDPFTFERAAAKWTARLAEAASRANGLLARYQAELAAAED
jgi:hypothetical protein